jgi:hypothetical protein
MSVAQRQIPSGAGLVRYLYPNGPPWARALPAPGETLILHGDPGSGIDEALAWIAEATHPAGPVVALDPRLVGDYPSLVRELVSSIAANAFDEDLSARLAVIGESPGGPLPELPEGRHDFLQLAAKLVEPSNEYSPGALAEVLRYLPSGLLVVRDAHLLTGRWARQALWELRGVVQDVQRHALVLGSLTEAHSDLVAPSAAFLGAGRIDPVGTDRGPNMWEQVLATHEIAVSREDLHFLLSRTHGLAVPTLRLLVDAEALGARAALEKHVRHASDQIAVTLKMARIITRYGPSLMLRLARGMPPYARPSATARDTNRALRQLAHHGLVARAGARAWRVADPLLSDALLSRPRALFSR